MDMEVQELHRIPDKESHYEKGDLDDAVNALAEQMAATEASKTIPPLKAATIEAMQMRQIGSLASRAVAARIPRQSRWASSQPDVDCSRVVSAVIAVMFLKQGTR
ncbi:hypothetical protein ANCCAN_18248 [Ancylostoma caninum]|uniref:Uncharacterized protein n=1 Tax=Ancylostoma caninum TaxID=29170 RepID=A0A368FYP9_ANCCA|nr:hypothetical protein ANCCAN_18248 [Ancylostoma caninum]